MEEEEEVMVEGYWAKEVEESRALIHAEVIHIHVQMQMQKQLQIPA